MSLKFAISREDHNAEILMVEGRNVEKALLFDSGGCTGMALQQRYPKMKITLFDSDSEQLQHVSEKLKLVAEKNLDMLNIDNDRSDGLSQCGVFEKLYCLIRSYLSTFIVSDEEILDFFRVDSSVVPEVFCDKLITSPYWSALFKAYFNDDFLSVVLGPDEISDSPPGSYEHYFRQLFESALLKENAKRNPWLHSMFLGYYLFSDAPSYLISGRKFEFTMHHAQLHEIENLSQYKLVSLSNIFDLSREHMIRLWAERLRSLEPGAVVIYRQFNNFKSYRHYFEPWFSFDDSLCQKLTDGERGLFYNKTEVAIRNFSD